MATSYTNYTVVISAFLPSDIDPARLADSLIQYLRGVHDASEVSARVLRDVTDGETVTAVEGGHAEYDANDDESEH